MLCSNRAPAFPAGAFFYGEFSRDFSHGGAGKESGLFIDIFHVLCGWMRTCMRCRWKLKRCAGPTAAMAHNKQQKETKTEGRARRFMVQPMRVIESGLVRRMQERQPDTRATYA